MISGRTDRQSSTRCTNSIGHLGIFVSGSVAKKEHDQFASNIDLIDALPPGLYEAVMTPKDPDDPSAELILGDYLLCFEARSLDDIRALGSNSAEVDREFATVARLSDINLGLYRTFVQPWIRAWVNESSAEWMRRCHPLRMQYEFFSGANPLLQPLSSDTSNSEKAAGPFQTTTSFGRSRNVLATGWPEPSMYTVMFVTTPQRRGFTRFTGLHFFRHLSASGLPMKASTVDPAMIPRTACSSHKK